MITLDLAQRLAAAGLTWTPRSGDRFVLPGRDMDDEFFVLSDMTIEVHDLPSGQIIGFNGTTEWALDEVSQQDAVWLPIEHQLRELLGDRFLRLETLEGGFVVVIRHRDGEGELREADVDAERAYARALLTVLTEPV